MVAFKYSLRQKVYIKGEIISREETLTENRYQIRDSKGNVYLFSEEDLISINESMSNTVLAVTNSMFPERQSRIIQLKRNTVLLTIEEAVEFAGGNLKAYKLRELCRSKGFYPAI